MTAVIPESTLTCPACGHVKTEAMPTDACQWFYECERCRTVLKPKPGDCCVFCSFGTVPCPPVQERDASTSGCRSCDKGTTADMGEKNRELPGRSSIREEVGRAAPDGLKRFRRRVTGGGIQKR